MLGIYNSNSDLNKYKIFYVVAEKKSFSKAAEALHLTQPAVSHAIKELESQLNTKLFIRDNKQIKLTDVGEKLIFYIQNAFNNIIKAENYVKNTNDNINGMIRIGIYSHLSLIIMPKIIKSFTEKYPNINFSIYSSSTLEMKEMLRHRELDIIIAQYPIFINDQSYKEEILCEMESCFFSSKKTYENLSINDISKDIPFILPFDGYADIDILEEKFKRHNLNITNNIRCYTNGLLKKLVEEDLGIGWGLKKCIEEELKNSKFIEIKTDFEIPKTIFSLVYDDHFINESTKKFINYLKDEVNKYVS